MSKVQTPTPKATVSCSQDDAQLQVSFSMPKTANCIEKYELSIDGYSYFPEKMGTATAWLDKATILFKSGLTSLPPPFSLVLTQCNCMQDDYEQYDENGCNYTILFRPDPPQPPTSNTQAGRHVGDKVAK